LIETMTAPPVWAAGDAAPVYPEPCPCHLNE